jgi:hypothetical protein
VGSRDCSAVWLSAFIFGYAPGWNVAPTEQYLRRDTGRVARRSSGNEQTLSFKRGEMPWTGVDAWRKELHHDFEHALAETKLPERPDYEAANRFLIKARRDMAKHE